MVMVTDGENFWVGSGKAFRRQGRCGAYTQFALGIRPVLQTSLGIGASLFRTKLRMDLIAVFLITAEQMAKMLIREDNDVIKALSPD